jgi:hypothetical protein
VTDSAQEPVEPGQRIGSLGWIGFLAAAVVVNVLFLAGIWSNASDASVGAWTVALAWLPFNFIATVLYLVFMAKLAKTRGGVLFVLLCAAMIAANWILMYKA